MSFVVDSGLEFLGPDRRRSYRVREDVRGASSSHGIPRGVAGRGPSDPAALVVAVGDAGDVVTYMYVGGVVKFESDLTMQGAHGIPAVMSHHPAAPRALIARARPASHEQHKYESAPRLASDQFFVDSGFLKDQTRVLRWVGVPALAIIFVSIVALLADTAVGLTGMWLGLSLFAFANYASARRRQAYLIGPVVASIFTFGGLFLAVVAAAAGLTA